MFSTTYLTVFLKHISDVALMREFLHFVTLSKFDGRPILDSLMQNIGSANHKVGLPLNVQCNLEKLINFSS